jgi:predicted  nucleic acid-binding Zn-ribbon protein
MRVLSEIRRDIHKMQADLQTVLARVTAEKTAIGGIQVILQTWTDDRAALRQKIADLQAQLDAAGQDTTTVAEILSDLDASDTGLKAINDQLAAAVVTNTPTGPAPGGDTATDTVGGGSGGDTVQGGTGDDATPPT